MFLPGDPLFLLFLIPVVAAYYLAPSTSLRLYLLLAVSLGYYVSFGVSFLVPFALVLGVSFGGPILLDRMAEGPQRIVLFWVLVALCLLPLAAYKYMIPLISSRAALNGYDWALTAGNYAVPIGISYYTFAGLGYLCDVYLAILPAERGVARVALYLGFFPHVTAGPIPRATAFLPQLKLDARFDTERIMVGLRLILVGACMKLWIADSLSSAVNPIFANPDAATALENLLAAGAFAFQLYADFAGYSLIAIGAAHLLGIQLGDNFRQPFLSATLQEFWRSWHISLFTWLRDYVFTTLRTELRKWPKAGAALAIQITLILVGIWHGTAWGFLAYGAVHGALLAISMLTLPRRDAVWRHLGMPAILLHPFRVVTTFTVIALSLVLIRASDLSQAMHIYSLIFTPGLISDLSSWGGTFRVLAFETQGINLVLVLAILIGDILAKRGVNFDRLPAPLMSPVYSVCVLAVLYQAISANASKPFVYFQF